jgi:2'-5' RNA ligase
VQRIRAFIAVEVSADVRSQARKLIQELSEVSPGVNWVDPQQMHVTLNFLGDVGMLDLPPLCKMMENVVAELPPFDVQFEGAGAFPNVERPRTIWLGVGEGADEFRELQRALQAGLDELGYRGESRQFRPHLTLGRVKGNDLDGSAELAERLAQHADYYGGASDVTDVTLFSSTLNRSGPTYNTISEASLRGS